jgi:hypothetical protein
MKNPYEGSQAVPVDGEVPRTAFRIFGRRVLRGAAFGAILLGGLMLAMVLLVRSQAPENSNAQEILFTMQVWSDIYAFGVSPLIALPVLYGVIGVIVGATLGAGYHIIAQLIRRLVGR